MRGRGVFSLMWGSGFHFLEFCWYVRDMRGGEVYLQKVGMDGCMMYDVYDLEKFRGYGS
jgi:hypothetical protein